MTILLRSQYFWCAVALWAGFWLVAPFIERRLVFELANAIGVSVGIGVIVAYGPDAMKAVRRPPRERLAGAFLVVGIVIACSGFVENRIYQWVWRGLGKPDWMEDQLIVAFFLWQVATGYMVHLYSVGAIHGYIPRRNLARLGVFVAAGVMLAFIVAWFTSST